MRKLRKTGAVDKKAEDMSESESKTRKCYVYILALSRKGPSLIKATDSIDNLLRNLSKSDTSTSFLHSYVWVQSDHLVERLITKTVNGFLKVPRNPGFVFADTKEMLRKLRAKSLEIGATISLPIRHEEGILPRKRVEEAYEEARELLIK